MGYLLVSSFLYLKNEIQEDVSWRVEILDEVVAAEIAALPPDMQARFLRLSERIASAGLESLSGPHVKHLEGKLWELRRRARVREEDQKTPRSEIELALRRAKDIT